MRFFTPVLFIAFSCTASADLSLEISDTVARARASTTCDSSRLKERAVGGLEKAAVVQTYCSEISGRDCDSSAEKALRADFVDLAYDCGIMTPDPAKKKACVDALEKRLDAQTAQRKSLEAAAPAQELSPEQFRATADGIATAHPGRKSDVTVFKNEIEKYIQASKGAKFDGHQSSFVLGEDIRKCLRADELLNLRLKHALDRLNTRNSSPPQPGGSSR